MDLTDHMAPFGCVLKLLAAAHLQALCEDVCQRVHLNGAPPQLCQPLLIPLQGIPPQLTHLITAGAQAQSVSTDRQHLDACSGGTSA